jgi:hypothetical protein
MRVLDYTRVADVKIEVAAVIESCGCLWEEEKVKKGKRVSTLGRNWWYALTVGVGGGLANGHQAKPLQPSRILDGGQSSFRPGPRILHLGIAKLSPIIHFTCSICLLICRPIRRTTQSMLDPYSFHLIVDIVFWHSTDGFSILPSAIAVAGLCQHQQRPWPLPWPKASRACWTRTASAKLRRTPAKTV